MVILPVWVKLASHDARDANKDEQRGLAQEGKESSSRSPQGAGVSSPRYNRAAVTPGATKLAL